MAIRLERRTDPDGSRVLLLVGDLDRAATRPLAAAVKDELDHSPRRLVFQMTRVSFCDSSGIVMLLEAHSEAARLGAELVLAGLGLHLRELFRISALDQIVRVVEESRD
ncbi:STAS domain-containing protein [Streptosporangium sp. NPDC006007]|uniref:STAS domain-containing protein n=1 Tax=Streptosporangium sp. NPDC006007 TaxID=3154575 RepID=UPI0033A88DC5